LANEYTLKESYLTFLLIYGIIYIEMEIIEILNIFEQYNIDTKYPISAEHDIIIFNINPEIIKQEDLNKLEKLGVFYSEEYCALIKFC